MVLDYHGQYLRLPLLFRYQQQKDYITFILLISTVFISAVVSFVQETKSDNAAKKLKILLWDRGYLERLEEELD